MNDQKLTHLLDALARDDIPPAPDHLESSVIQHIGSLRKPEKSSSSLSLKGFPHFPRLTVGIALVAILIGWAVGSIRIRSSDQVEQLLARNALSLKVFHPSISPIPSNSLYP